MDFSSLMMDHIPEEKKMQVRIVQLFVKNEFNKEKHRGTGVGLEVFAELVIFGMCGTWFCYY